ncbi:hypothetical protein RYX36_014058, partial [Vicia faba]
RYLSRVPPENNDIMEFIEARRKANWTYSIDTMNWAQLEMFKKDLEELRNLVAQHVNSQVIQDTHTQTLLFGVDNVSPSNIPFQHQLFLHQDQMFTP